MDHHQTPSPSITRYLYHIQVQRKHDEKLKKEDMEIEFFDINERLAAWHGRAEEEEDDKKEGIRYRTKKKKIPMQRDVGTIKSHIQKNKRYINSTATKKRKRKRTRQEKHGALNHTTCRSKIQNERKNTTTHTPPRNPTNKGNPPPHHSFRARLHCYYMAR